MVIVKINVLWFDVCECGVFGVIFGILILLGVYFVFDVGKMIVDYFLFEWVFFVFIIVLVIVWVVVKFFVVNIFG